MVFFRGGSKRFWDRELVPDGARVANVSAVSNLVLAERTDSGTIHPVGCEHSYVRLRD